MHPNRAKAQCQRWNINRGKPCTCGEEHTSYDNVAWQSERHLRRMYKMTPEQFNEILARQGGHCYFCPRGPDQFQMVVEHDHRCCPGGRHTTCGKCVRAIVCKRCNSRIGWIEGDWDRIVEYVNMVTPLSTEPARSV